MHCGLDISLDIDSEQSKKMKNQYHSSTGVIDVSN